jgi:hypothetical protein
MPTRIVRLLAAVAIICAAAAGLRAAVPTFWLVSTESEFLKGELENLALDSYGRLTLGPVVTPVYEATAPFLWTLASTPDGTVYIGSGNEGQVYQVDNAGRGRVFFDADELEVHAIVPAPGGGIFVATAPEGKIYKVEASGASRVYFDPPEPYIWSLAIDRTGVLFAGTGDKGTIYRIASDGTGTVFYQTKATHVMSLAFDRDGRLLAGTGAPGRLFRIEASGRAFVLLDSTYGELRTLRVDQGGVIYAAAVTGRPAGGVAGGEPVRTPDPVTTSTGTATVTTEITVVSVADASASGGTQASRPAGGPTAGAVLRIQPDGASDVVWESREDAPYDLALEPGGAVLVATGGKGKLFRLSGDPAQATLVARANAQQTTALLPARDGQMLVATSNPGTLLRLSSTRADRGTYTSEVRDAQGVAAWGTIKWQAAPGGGTVAIATRSGNTRTPDDAWSDWSPAYATADGSAITSPRARYLQWRAVLSGGRTGAPVLTSLSAAYLPRNARPKVTSVTVNAPGTVYQKPFPVDPDIAGFEGETPNRRAAQQAQGASAGGGSSLGRRVYEKGLLTFVWRGEDDNRDDLVYEVQYRREGDTAWKTLRAGLTEPILVWDTTSVPNGRYVVRVVASDAPSNAPASALTGWLESSSFEIDNAPPAIAVTAVRREGARTTIAFDVRDDQSAVLKVEYSLDGDRWHAVYPRDGIADSRLEQFELVLEADAGAKGVILRAADALNNVSSARGEAPAAAPASGGTGARR